MKQELQCSIEGKLSTGPAGLVDPKVNLFDQILTSLTNKFIKPLFQTISP